jgi:hypothetical protein
MTLIRASASSSSSVAAKMRAAPAVVVVVLAFLALAVRQTDAQACTVAVKNLYKVPLSLYTYDGSDGLCAIPFDTFSVDAGGCTSVDFGGDPSLLGWVLGFDVFRPVCLAAFISHAIHRVSSMIPSKSHIRNATPAVRA